VEFPELVSGQLIKRYKRFLADVRLDSGEEVTAHCANPGSMKSLLVPAPRVWLSRARPGRKLPFTWEVAELEGARVYVNPVGANRVVAEALELAAIPELSGYDVIQPEVKYGTGSRIDFLLSGPTGKAYVEVKNVTLGLGKGRSAFPDSVTARGTKHLLELAEVKRSGHRAVLLFCVSRTDALSVEAAADIDPTYAKTLAQVMQQGVEVLAYAGDIDEKGFRLSRSVPVIAP
jgi:sugar fermentation stimulation protein A